MKTTAPVYRIVSFNFWQTEDQLTLQTPSPSTELPARNTKVIWQYMLMHREPTKLPQSPSNESRYRSCKSLFFPLNI
jgi:hypothetical protein